MKQNLWVLYEDNINQKIKYLLEKPYQGENWLTLSGQHADITHNINTKFSNLLTTHLTN